MKTTTFQGAKDLILGADACIINNDYISSFEETPEGNLKSFNEGLELTLVNSEDEDGSVWIHENNSISMFCLEQGDEHLIKPVTNNQVLEFLDSIS